MFASEIRNDYGYYYNPAKGAPILVEIKWLDIIVYLDIKGETIRYFVSESESDKFMAYGGVKVYDEWIDSEYSIVLNLPFGWEQDLGPHFPISEVDFIRHGNGSILEYLSNNIDSYQNNKVKVDDFCNKEIEFVTQDKLKRHGF